MATKANKEQVATFLGALVTLLLGKHSEKISKIDGEKIQQAIDTDDKAGLLDRIIKFINNGCNFVLVIAQHVINFDTEAKVPFEGAKLDTRTGLTGNVSFEPKKWIAKNELKDGETSITGHEFLKRLQAGKKVLPNSNMIDWLIEHQDEPGVKEFLDQYRGKVLYAFGDIFRNSGGDLCVRCALVSDERWVSRCSWLDDGFLEHDLALFLANTK